MNKKNKKSLLKTAFQFIKLQAVGNILFWGTYAGYFISDVVFHKPTLLALAISSLLAHALFFILSRDWVFDPEGKQRKTRAEVVRFIIFMGVNYFLNLGIIYGLERYFGLTPYIGQFISAGFSTLWNFVGLKWWVFRKHGR